MSNQLPMMPFWPKEWIAGTMHWPCAERGAYISLLAFQWINGHVPPDVPQLARITGSSELEFEKLWQTVGAKFDAGTVGLFNRRAEEHRKEALRLRDARTFGASLANQKRAAKRDARRLSAANDPGFEAANDADAQRDAQTTHTSPSPSPSSEDQKKTERKRSANAQRVSRGTVEAFDENWLLFKLAFPLRAGGQPWKAAISAWRARLAEGHAPELIIAGAERYAEFIKAKGDERTTFVMHAKTFLGPEKYFLQDWHVPAAAAASARWVPPGDDLAEPS
jgi:uncharacterized protein YdaU (DUF1376 family)